MLEARNLVEPGPIGRMMVRARPEWTWNALSYYSFLHRAFRIQA
jgi:hypothetical protein